LGKEKGTHKGGKKTKIYQLRWWYRNHVGGNWPKARGDGNLALKPRWGVNLGAKEGDGGWPCVWGGVKLQTLG